MRSYLKVFLIIFIPIAILIGAGYKIANKAAIDNATKELAQEMRTKAELLKGYKLSTEFDPDIHAIISGISQNTNLRITIIRKDGGVIDDSYYSYEKIQTMENHAKRPEIISALNSDEGSSVRRSTTAEESMNYYAMRYSDDIVLRLAYPMSYIDALQANMLQQNVTLYVSLLIIVAFIALYLARRLSSPIQKLSEVADKIEAGETKIYFPSFADKTMTKLVSVIYRIYNSMNQKTKQLEQEKQKLNHIFSILDEGIILLDSKNNVMHYNSKASHYLGIKINIGENILRQTNNMEAISFLTEVVGAEESKKLQKNLKGKIFEVFVRIFENEKLIAFFDITERAEYEQFKTELVGNITHELKTPLAMIMGYSETIMNDPEMDRKFHDKFINIIYNSSNRLNLLINDILKLHKLEMLREEITVDEPTNIEDLFDEIKNFYKDCPMTVNVDYTSDDVNILREHLVSLITNLTDNAVKYSKGKNIFIKMTADPASGRVILDVEDEGPAIPEDEQQRIFERFYTMDKSKNQNATGTGLGLSIVKHIVSLYNGEVSVKSNERGGNTFSVILEEKEKIEHNA